MFDRCKINGDTLHRVVSIEYVAKPDSFEIVCSCGHKERIGCWYKKPPAQWKISEDNWVALVLASEQFIVSLHKEYYG